MRIGTLREHGDFGLGTFEGLDGELVAVDGDFFRIRDDGALHPVDDEVLSPYAMVTQLHAGSRGRPPGVRRLRRARRRARRSPRLRQPLLRLPRRRRLPHAPCPRPRARCRRARRWSTATEQQAEWRLDDVDGYARRVLVARLRRALRRPRLPLPRRRRRSAAVAATCSRARPGRRPSRVQRLEQLVVALPETPDFLTADLAEDPSGALDVAERAALDQAARPLSASSTNRRSSRPGSRCFRRRL